MLRRTPLRSRARSCLCTLKYKNIYAVYVQYSSCLHGSFRPLRRCVYRVNRFSIELVENNQDKLRAVVVLRDKLDYNEKMIYHLMLTATVSTYGICWLFHLHHIIVLEGGGVVVGVLGWVVGGCGSRAVAVGLCFRVPALRNMPAMVGWHTLKHTHKHNGTITMMMMMMMRRTSRRVPTMLYMHILDQ